MSAVKRALFLSTGERYFALAGNFAMLAVTSRILTPSEIGVSVIGMAVVNMAISVREFASAAYIVQHRDLTSEAIRGAFTAMFFLTTMIAATIVLLAPTFADLYGEVRLTRYLQVVSASLVVELVATIVMALLRREMAFGRAAVISIAAVATGMTTTIGLAFLGFSYMSFAWGWLAGALVSAAVALCLRPHFWMFRPIFSKLNEMVAFGGYYGAAVFLYKIYEALPYLVLGGILPPHAIALFNRAVMICQLPDKIFLGGAMSVALSAFSAEAREGRNLKGPYLYALSLATALQWPALVVLIVLVEPIVQIMLGGQWGEAVSLVRIAACAYLFAFAFEINYPVFVSMGATRDIFLRALIICPVSALVMVGSALAGGLTAMTWSLLFIIPFQAFVAFRFLRRRMEIAWREVAAATWRSAVVAATSFVGPFVVVMSAEAEPSFGQAGLAVLLAGLGWLAGLAVTRHPLREEIVKTLPVFRRAAAAHS